MSAPVSPYRVPAGSCALCQEEAKAEELESLARLPACARCRSGDLDDALRAHGFREERIIVDPKNHSSEVKDHGFRLEVTIPSNLEVVATLSAEGPVNWFTKLFHKPDPEEGSEEFDSHIRIDVEPEHEAALMAILESPGTREAVMHLIGMGCRSINVTNSLLTVVARQWDPGKVPPIDDARTSLLALALHLEGNAKGRATA